MSLDARTVLKVMKKVSTPCTTILLEVVLYNVVTKVKFCHSGVLHYGHITAQRTHIKVWKVKKNQLLSHTGFNKTAKKG